MRRHQVAPTPTEAVVANGVNGKVAEAVAPEEDADAAEEKPAEVETKEDGEVKCDVVRVDLNRRWKAT